MLEIFQTKLLSQVFLWAQVERQFSICRNHLNIRRFFFNSHVILNLNSMLKTNVASSFNFLAAAAKVFAIAGSLNLPLENVKKFLYSSESATSSLFISLSSRRN